MLSRSVCPGLLSLDVEASLQEPLHLEGSRKASFAQDQRSRAAGPRLCHVALVGSSVQCGAAEFVHDQVRSRSRFRRFRNRGRSLAGENLATARDCFQLSVGSLVPRCAKLPAPPRLSATTPVPALSSDFLERSCTEARKAARNATTRAGTSKNVSTLVDFPSTRLLRHANRGQHEVAEFTRHVLLSGILRKCSNFAGTGADTPGSTGHETTKDLHLGSCIPKEI